MENNTQAAPSLDDEVLTDEDIAETEPRYAEYLNYLESLDSSSEALKSASKDLFLQYLEKLDAFNTLAEESINLYYAGTWKIEGMAEDLQKLHWERFRDAAGFPDGTSAAI